MSDRRTENGENAVAGRLHHIAVVAADRVDHELERRIDKPARLFGIEIQGASQPTSVLLV